MNLTINREKLINEVRNFKPALGLPSPEIANVLQSNWKFVNGDQLRATINGEEFAIFVTPKINWKNKAQGLTITLEMELASFKDRSKVLFTFPIVMAERFLEEE